MVEGAHQHQYEGAREGHSIKLSDGDLIAATKICHEVIKSKKKKSLLTLLKESIYGIFFVLALLILIFIMSSIL